MTRRKISAMMAASAAVLCFCACGNFAESGASSAESSSSAAVTTTATAEQPAATITAVMTEAADESSETETQPAEPHEIDLQGRAIEYCDGANISVETNVSYDSQADTVMQRRILVHFDGLDYIISEITDEGISLYG